jgi:putrescine transport system permease protein
VLTACASVAIGTWAGFVLARMGRFRGFTLYTGMINAPLVIPEVIQGISLLLLFVEMAKVFGWPAGRGMFTIWVGHVMLCISYVAIIVESRVRELNPSLEEAALDLGATPWRGGCCRSRCRSTTSCSRRSCRGRARPRCRSSCSRACGSG